MHVVLNGGPTSMPYNEFFLAAPPDARLGLCSYYPIETDSVTRGPVTHGGGTPRGFLRAVSEMLRQFQPDVVHAHSPHVAALLALAHTFHGVPISATRVLTIHNSWGSMRPRDKLLYALAAPTFHRMVFCSAAAKASLPRSTARLLASHIDAIPNGVDLAGVRPASEKRSDGALRIVTIARLEPIKNLETTIRAFGRASTAPTRLRIIGEGSLRMSLERLIEQEGLGDRVSLVGLMPRQRVYDELADADLYMSVSKGEGLPVSAMEAMATGLPVLLSDIPPHRELYRGGGPILADPNDLAAIASALREVLEDPPEKRFRRGRACRDIVERAFSLDSMHQGYAALYREAMAAG